MKVPAKGLRQSRCRECAKASSRAHYEANREKTIARSAASKGAQQKALREEVARLLEGRCCSRCGATEDLVFKRNADYTGPRVSAVINQGMATDTLQESIRNSAIVCKTCDRKDGAEGLKAFTKAKKLGQLYKGSPLTRAEQKDANTRAVTDLRKGRAESGRLLYPTSQGDTQ